ncbi:multicopper oxidase family protein [Azospirillum doebereinerae]|uniref:multicopper oxidase family protein n=1 Tax=Azospirillum doebereinerae TaxID=92933 RepID=UPI001EE590DE|nr:multicopper oxidase domain-containing protein [Azospirillum doebereinerae]MCG5244031.1 multicopper oxidase domain-containing protein [Azospirillum doebereinerae]
MPIPKRPADLRRSRAGLAALATLTLPALLAAAPAGAQDAALRRFANPPVALPEASLGVPPPSSLVEQKRGAVAAPDTRGTIVYDFDIRMVEGKIYNPWTKTDDTVKLRAYQGTMVDPAVPFLAPTITMKPDQTARITLNNRLEPEPGCERNILSVNVPHCFNTTNLHSHGLWVSPTGNSDNVMITIKPGVSFQYEYNVPNDHPAGTFWYHPHNHGSTALQVSSGMAGALIIKDERKPFVTGEGRKVPGDIDILLKDSKGEAFPDKAIVFEQVQYACRDAEGHIEPWDKSLGVTLSPWDCEKGQVGQITSYDQFGPNTQWQNSGRFTSINGRVQPLIDGVTAGRFERWRLIHAGVRETVNVQFQRLKPGAPDARTVAAADQPAWIAANCQGAPLPSWEIALDGLTRAQARQTARSILQPGYRVDLVTYFPDEGSYCVLDSSSTGSANVSATDKEARLLGVVQATKGTAPSSADPAALLRDQMTEAARRTLDGAVLEEVVAGLANNLRLENFVWHKTVEEKELTGAQELVFNITTDPSGNAVFQVNGESFQPNRIDRDLLLGSVDQWTLTSELASHPFHIHVNPFQIVEIRNNEGMDVSGNALPANAADEQYRGLKGTWKDTLWVQNAGSSTPNKGKYTVVVRTRYQRYIGEFVLHCHILDHEDQGMMQNVRISVPDGKGGIAHAHH